MLVTVEGFLKMFFSDKYNLAVNMPYLRVKVANRRFVGRFFAFSSVEKVSS